LSPGTSRRVPSESGKNLAKEIATQIDKIATVILNLDYPYSKQQITRDKVEICQYTENIPQEMDYFSLNKAIQRPADMPKLVGLET